MQEYIEEINTCEIGLQLLEKIRNIHKDQRLCGEPGNVLLDAHDDLLLYILALLRGDAHFLPELSLEVLPEISIDEWKKLLKVLRCHQIIPLLYYKTCNVPPEFHPPGEIRDQMRTAFLISRIQSLKIERQLNDI